MIGKDTKDSIKKIIDIGKVKGFLTFDEIDEILAPSKVTQEQKDILITMLNEIDISVVEKTIKGGHNPISNKFIDSWGEVLPRGGSTDLEKLPTRCDDGIQNLIGFRGDDEAFVANIELRNWIESAHEHYDKGEYAKALNYLNFALQKMPAIEPHIFYYIRVCERVLSIPLSEKEIESDSIIQGRNVPKWLRWITENTLIGIRCKWCGHYTHFNPQGLNPNYLSRYFDIDCRSCDCLCPMPSWILDSPEGRAYCYYSGLYEHEEFYKEIEQDYDPKPLSKHRLRI